MHNVWHAIIYKVSAFITSIVRSGTIELLPKIYADFGNGPKLL